MSSPALMQDLGTARLAEAGGRPCELGITACGCSQHRQTAGSRVGSTERHDHLHQPIINAACGGSDIAEKVVDDRALRGEIGNERLDAILAGAVGQAPQEALAQTPALNSSITATAASA
jgi:hypothetical protein